MSYLLILVPVLAIGAPISYAKLIAAGGSSAGIPPSAIIRPPSEAVTDVQLTFHLAGVTTRERITSDAGTDTAKGVYVLVALDVANRDSKPLDIFANDQELHAGAAPSPTRTSRPPPGTRARTVWRRRCRRPSSTRGCTPVTAWVRSSRSASFRRFRRSRPQEARGLDQGGGPGAGDDHTGSARGAPRPAGNASGERWAASMSGPTPRPGDERPLHVVPAADETAEEPTDEPGREVAVRDETTPATVEAITGTVLPWRQEVRPRPVFAAWIVDRDELGHAGRWLVVYVGHTSAFHLVRVPQYAFRTVMYAPRGAGRAVWLWWQWVTDAEGHPLRLNARDKRQTSDYVTLVRLRDQRVRPRAIASAIAGAAAAVAVPVTSLWWPWEPYALAGVAVVVLGYVGRRLDRPFFAPAVLTSPEAPRLTGEIVVRGLASLGIPAIREALKTPPGITFASECHRDGPGWRVGTSTYKERPARHHVHQA